MKKTTSIILAFLLTLTVVSCGNYHTNKDGTTLKTYQKDIDTIYVNLREALRYEFDDPAYKIDLKNNTYWQIRTYAAVTRDEWGTEEGDRDFELVSKLKDSKIDEFFNVSARYGFTQWKAEYHNWNVLDGAGWYMKIIFSDGTVKEMYGVNAYPETWEEMMGAFEALVGEPLKYSLATQAEIDVAYADRLK
ncbi:MAG: hypothetical protein LBO63_02725 [Oscillospiraceae bacterium]|jgi:hypothetical protein|nr:hypothetical protein [Oscillospiraceae bacterium]